MAAGTVIKAIVLIIVSAMVFGFCSSTVVHNQIWDNVKEAVGDIGLGDGDDGNGNGNGSGSYYEYPQTATYNLTQTITITPSSGSITNFTYRTPIPMDTWNDQSVQIMNGLGPGSTWDNDLDVDTSSVPDWAYIYYNESFSEAFSFSIYYNFTSEFKIWDITAADSAEVFAIPIWYNDTYVRNQEWDAEGTTVGINLTAASIAAGEAFNGDETNVLEILHKAFIWVVDNIDYFTDGSRLKSVAETTADRTGDCDDMSTLMISMVRSMGVPAWLEQGILYNSNTGAWEHHAWVQAYVPLTNGSYVNITIDPTNNQFALFSPDRLIVYTDVSGDETLMEEYYKFIGIYAEPSTTVTASIDLTTTYLQSSGTVQVPVSHMTW